MDSKITRLPSQAVAGNSFGRYPKPSRRSTLADDQQRYEYEREAYLIDGWQDDRRS